MAGGVRECGVGMPGDGAAWGPGEGSWPGALRGWVWAISPWILHPFAQFALAVGTLRPLVRWEAQGKASRREGQWPWL